MHPYLLTYCLIGRPSSSEDPDLRTARKTSGPKGRGGKQKVKNGSPSTSDGSGSETSGAYTDVDLSSSAIRMFAGAGEVQSRAQVKKEHAAVAAANAQEQAPRVQQAHTGKLVTAVEALSAAVVSRQALDEEAAHRARWDYARLAKQAKIDDLRGKLEFTLEGPKAMALRASISALYDMDDADFMPKPISAPTPPAAGGAPSTSASASVSSAAPPPATTPEVTALPASITTSPAASTPASAAGLVTLPTSVSSSPDTPTPTSSVRDAAPIVLGATRARTRANGLPGFTGARKRGVGDVGHEERRV
ncbi:unnamed protein product [Ectocarpus sp. CCAP 1310/34]|nr:unnamed protein product [Ectocarpus sp. CCAP 1310/34]